MGFITNINNPVSEGLLFGKDTLTNDLSNTGLITNLKIKNCNARQCFVSTDTSEAPTTVLPESEWGSDYIMKVNFAVSTQGGNVGAMLLGLKKLLFKRKVKGDFSPNAWKTIYTYEIIEGAHVAEDLRNIFFKDFLARANETYCYTIVPVTFIDGQIVEGSIDYDEEEMPSATSKFESVIISDGKDYQKLYAGVAFGTATNQQLYGVHETLGAQYPIVVSNSNVNYMAGTVSGTVINKEYYNGDYVFDRGKLVKAREEMQAFLSNKKPKIVKDWNGNIWLTQISAPPTYTFNDSWGMGMANVSFNWVELGSLDDQETLDQMNLIVNVGGDVDG